jgi:murein L,D-transpeptidase YafK
LESKLTRLKKLLFGGSFIIMALVVYYFYPEKKLPTNATIDKIVVLKSKREMLVYSGNQLLKTYTISLGKVPVGAKESEKDGRTPEGNYTVNAKNPNSTCYKNLGISYPNANDITKSKTTGLPTGGDIKIHGMLNGYGFIGKFHRFADWTAGCIALTDDEMDEVYNHTPVGASIEIRP